VAIATSRNDDGYVRRQSQASHHDIAGESFEIQRAGQAGGNAVDRTRDKLDNGVVESVGRKFGPVDPGVVLLLEQLKLDAGESKSLADVRTGLPLQGRRHDIRNANVERMIELQLIVPILQSSMPGRKSRSSGFCNCNSLAAAPRPETICPFIAIGTMKASDSFRFEIDRRGESHCQLTVLSQNTSRSFALAHAAASVIARSQRVARMRARNLPVVTSECVCDTLVRRANPFPRGKGVKASFVIATMANQPEPSSLRPVSAKASPGVVELARRSFSEGGKQGPIRRGLS
jgi:hypothetical protein